MASKWKNIYAGVHAMIWNAIVRFFEAAGRARAAGEFSRLGRHDLAKKIMLEGRE
jgi:hypothetical protein